MEQHDQFNTAKEIADFSSTFAVSEELVKIYLDHLRWLNRVMQDHEARASDINRKVIFSFFLLFSKSKLLKHNKQGPKFAVQQSPLKSRLLVSN